MTTIKIGTINLRDLQKKIRREFPTQTEQAHSTKKGKKGYNRKRAKHETQRNHNDSSFLFDIALLKMVI